LVGGSYQAGTEPLEAESEMKRIEEIDYENLNIMPLL